MVITYFSIFVVFCVKKGDIFLKIGLKNIEKQDFFSLFLC